MIDLYVIGLFREGKLVDYVRKGRNWSISAYNDFDSAKRGLVQTRGGMGKHIDRYKLIKLNSMEIVEI